MRDFEAYYAAGEVWNAGGDPYGPAIWNAERALPGVNAQRNEVLPFVGPPVLLPVFGAVARLPFQAANTLWRALLAISAAALLLCTLRAASVPIGYTTFLLGAVVALGFGPLTSAVALGQLALPAFACAAFSIRRPAWSIVAWIQPNIGASTLAAWQGAASAALVAALCLAVTGLNGFTHYAALIGAHGSAERFSAIQISPSAVAYGFGAGAALSAAAGTVVAALAIAAWVLFVLPVKDVTERFAATCALLPLAMPFFHEHDLVVTFFPALYFALRASPATMPFALAGASICAVDWLGLAQRPDALLQSVLLIAAFSCALVALRANARARELALPVLACIVVAAAGFAASLHPAPVWPDAMRGGITLGPLAQTWHAELAATGLFAHNAAWAALRAASLCGCVLLFFAWMRQMSTSIMLSNCETALGWKFLRSLFTT